MAPQTTKQWTIEGQSGFDDLKYHDAAPLPKELDNNEVLVNFHYASLNYRDLIIPKGQYPFPMKSGVIPGSDGAGTVVAVGKSVQNFKAGDKVVSQFGPLHQSGHVAAEGAAKTLGGGLDGVLTEYAVFPDYGLVHMPKTLDFQEAAALPCAALTAWNCLYGLEGRGIIPGQYVLTQGTGGVSIFVLQFAKAAGCTVIATTSSQEKVAKLKQLGADHVINYKTDSKWGETAKSLTPNNAGVDHVIEVGGASTQEQSLKAIKPEGVISIVGFLGGADTGPPMISALRNLCTIRGVIVGSVAQFEAMNAAIDANGIKPVVDEKVFELKDLKQAYEYMLGQNHFGKLTVKIS